MRSRRVVLRSRSVPSSSFSINDENPTTSAERIAARRRVVIQRNGVCELHWHVLAKTHLAASEPAHSRAADNLTSGQGHQRGHPQGSLSPQVPRWLVECRPPVLN